jgi:Pentapeptide repeats (8 copies)
LHVLKRWAALPRGIRWLAIGSAVVLGLAIAWALFVPIADWLAHHDVGSAQGSLHETALDNARGRLLTLGAGLFVAGALLYTARNFTLSREAQVTDRYTKAIEQLGSDKGLDVRIGGIYALERIARDSPRDHPTIMEVLTAFVRERSRERWPPAEDGAKPPDRLTRPDVQAAVTVIGRRTIRHDSRQINLVAAQLIYADLSGADLSGANLYRADLSGADLYRADLGGAVLTGAVLAGAHLAFARLPSANLDGADLGGAVLTGAVLAGARWPRDAAVPVGWKRNASGFLVAAATGSDPVAPS